MISAASRGFLFLNYGVSYVDMVLTPGSIFDCHSHVQFPVYDSDREVVIQRAKEAGVKMLAVGTQASTSEAAIKLTHEYPEDIWATVGFHPAHATHARTYADSSGLTRTSWYFDPKEQRESTPEKFDIEKLRQLAKDPKVVAIGECGLDYFRLDKETLRQAQGKQKEVFLEQVELAKELNKPLMIHCRPSKGTDDAYEDMLNMLSAKRLAISRVVHFYVGSLEMTKKLVTAGFYFTFGGVITFARDYDESIKYIPLDRILLETDCPYVAPAPYRGKRNEPAYIIETAKKMAEIKNVSLEKLAESVYENTAEVFKVF